MSELLYQIKVDRASSGEDFFDAAMVRRFALVPDHSSMWPDNSQETFTIWQDLAAGRYRNMAMGAATLLIARFDEQPVGVCGVRGSSITDHYVVPGFTGNGIGGLLLERAMEANPSRQLNVTVPVGSRALYFYSMNGFWPEEGRPGDHYAELWDGRRVELTTLRASSGSPLAN